jgi:hypothetical protein
LLQHPIVRPRTREVPGGPGVEAGSTVSLVMQTPRWRKDLPSRLGASAARSTGDRAERSRSRLARQRSRGTALAGRGWRAKLPDPCEKPDTSRDVCDRRTCSAASAAEHLAGIVARFSSIGDLRKAAPVRIAGVHVGQVGKIQLADYVARRELPARRSCLAPT